MAIVLVVVGGTFVQKGAELEFLARDRAEFNLTVAPGSASRGRLPCQRVLYLRDALDCPTVLRETRVEADGLPSACVLEQCGAAQPAWFKRLDPAIRPLGHIVVENATGLPAGEYRITSSTGLWAVDACAQIDKSVADAQDAAVLFAAGHVVALCALTCCCCGTCHIIARRRRRRRMGPGASPALLGKPSAPPRE